MTFASKLSLAGLLALIAAVGFAFWRSTAAQDQPLTTRAVLPMLARDYEDEPLPPVDPTYCALPTNPAAPPTHEVVLGTLRIGGNPAPAGTIVQVFFNGKAGPAERISEAGGYRILYDVGGRSCANRAGAEVAVRVAGHSFPASARVGDQLVVRFDINVP